MDTYEELRLREWLAQQLRMGDVPGPLWTELKNRHYVAEALDKEYEGGEMRLLKQLGA